MISDIIEIAQIWFMMAKNLWYILLPLIFIIGWIFYDSFKPPYGVLVVTGKYGAGKTFNVFDRILSLKWKYRRFKPIVISNVPYHMVDFTFNSKDEFDILISYVVRYMNDTNTEECLKLNDFRPLFIVLDEAPNYLNAKTFMKNFTGGDSSILLSQLRKRRILFYAITQEFSWIDKSIRLMTPYVRTYKNAVLGVGLYFNSYIKTEVTDIKGEYGKDSTSVEVGYPMPYLRPGSNIFKFFNLFASPSRDRKEYFSEKHLTNYIVGLDTKIENKGRKISDVQYDEFLTTFTQFFKKSLQSSKNQ